MSSLSERAAHTGERKRKPAHVKRKPVVIEKQAELVKMRDNRSGHKRKSSE